ncbi:MAG: hypothetical protein J5I65_01190 [Aridibacter famidurans]|nr:hypothetical protein [Aridibacter famidurans]
MTYTAIRAFSFFTAFTIGLFFVSGVQAFNDLSDTAAGRNTGSTISDSGRSTSAEGFVEIRYLGSGVEDGNEVFRFEAYNAGDSEAVFMSYPDSGLDGLQFKIDGTEKALFLCGTGMVERVLGSGASIEFSVSKAFLDHLMKDGGKTLSVGHYFKRADSDEYIAVWSGDVALD